MSALLYQELGIFDCVVLKHIKDDSFLIHFANDNWFRSLFPDNHVGDEVVLNDTPYYLVDFLYDAKEFWRLNSNGRINSGIWSEQTGRKVLRLEAAAISKDEEHFLVLFNLENEYNKRQNTLQIARELLISNDKVLEQHEVIRERIEALAVQRETQGNVSLPVKEVIESAEFGVAIIDHDLQLVEQNPALFRLFEMLPGDVGRPAALLLELCQRQFPEFQRILETRSRWSGELYWMKPPSLSRWMQLTVSPVESETEGHYWLLLVTDISREKYLQQSNEKLTYFDVLTNLPNRQYYWQCLENAIEVGQSFFAMQLDIKQLKSVNEVFGFTVGDILLKELAERLRQLVSPNDVLARIGGNEFAVILRETQQEKCEQIARKMISDICAPYYVMEQQYKCSVGVRIGVSHFPYDSVVAEELMKYADLASFSIKQGGKSAVQFYSRELKESSLRRMELEAALRDAIDNGEFELFLQPILDLDTGKISQAEALIRWRRPGIGLIFPDEFIPIAEKSGLIIAIGKWVIQEASRLLAVLHQQDQFIKLSLNLSPSQVSDRSLLGFIQRHIEANHVDPTYLELELTENVLVNDFERINHFLSEVRKMGVSVAIDDFGTGYSSLSYLPKLPIDFIKIDRSFIGELIDSDSNRAIVLAILAMANSLKLGVIAEGVEVESQKAFLREHHCQSAQGYLFSRPVPFDEFCKLLRG
ncbi:putative bifunctional diguanylate cyclase/phosphodiesterase [Marinomonas mediterranea]|jgi:diguanylate cyclase (GGDEF) domain|uniref:Diguanylate cyclase/phosphodiesterase n=1 Tax=Marinomonas mediterranea (strain ATCC 700492 / JCM 21426 / NBRC 103028 / MMB-1) TaxID=717774 RepID=F2JUS9_MARM1|nr:EAL domain-containing protein [Marinomonas mediterranea]ADZ90494.1 diguanylate cyclase/phosphodiesterase [Marinomonas mediterranea MMB-1]WCN08547.1 EAL domain-containing protein [Marinomonas mediterranea]WCN12601.1 EAL domain-containing protein [Marinomonas mediterranea]WCN16673.1 EAL domain-containing protein [Marinomonas mediterranea MMB-1]